MSEPKFTPGPWEIVHGRRDCPHMITPVARGSSVAVVSGYGDPTNRANARLIAAAPELYAALQYAFEHAPNNFYLDGKASPAEWIEKARAALAKAEGR